MRTRTLDRLAWLFLFIAALYFGAHAAIAYI